MWVEGVEWTKDSSGAVWQGAPMTWKSIRGFVQIGDHPTCFTVTVHVEGTLRHLSEHACLCEAQKAGSEAMRRAHELREGAE